jgi:hypothetical protein
MNGIAILALCLGLVSVIVTLKYLKLYENLSKNINKLSSNCGKQANSSIVTEIQTKLNLTDLEMDNRLKSKSEDIAKLLSTNVPLGIVNTQANAANNAVVKDVAKKKNTRPTPKNKSKKPIAEKFNNYDRGSYLYNEPTGILVTNKLENSLYIDSIGRDLDINSLSPYIISNSKPISTIYSYEKDFEITKNHINNLDRDNTLPPIDYNNISIRRVKNNSDRDLKYNFIKDNWCMVNHDDKNYCFSISEKTTCPGEIVDNRQLCSY